MYDKLGLKICFLTELFNISKYADKAFVNFVAFSFVNKQAWQIHLNYENSANYSPVVLSANNFVFESRPQGSIQWICIVMATNFIIAKRSNMLFQRFNFQIDFGTIIQVLIDPIIQDSTGSSETLLFSCKSFWIIFVSNIGNLTDWIWLSKIVF